MPTIQIKIGYSGSTIRKIKYHNPLKQAVLTTLSFFDIFSRPLKLKEIRKYLFRTAASTIDIAIMLKRLQNTRIIQEKNNYYFLRGRQNNIVERQRRTEISNKKINRACFYAKFLQLIPFIRSVSIANSLSFHSAKEMSDIDLFIITQKNRLWISRTLANLLFMILGIRRRKNREQDPDRFCLSFFISTKKMNLNEIYRQPFDPYLSFWLAGLKPVYGIKIFNQFVAKNLWYKKELPNHKHKIKSQYFIKQKKSLFGFLRFIVEKIINSIGANTIDKWLYRWQSKMIIEGADWNEVGIGIIANRQMLKTHAHDKRQHFREKLEEKLRQNLKQSKLES